MATPEQIARITALEAEVRQLLQRCEGLEEQITYAPEDQLDDLYRVMDEDALPAFYDAHKRLAQARRDSWS